MLKEISERKKSIVSLILELNKQRERHVKYRLNIASILTYYHHRQIHVDTFLFFASLSDDDSLLWALLINIDNFTTSE